MTAEAHTYYQAMFGEDLPEDAYPAALFVADDSTRPIQVHTAKHGGLESIEANIEQRLLRFSAAIGRLVQREVVEPVVVDTGLRRMPSIAVGLYKKFPTGQIQRIDIDTVSPEEIAGNVLHAWQHSDTNTLRLCEPLPAYDTFFDLSSAVRAGIHRETVHAGLILHSYLSQLGTFVPDARSVKFKAVILPYPARSQPPSLTKTTSPELRQA